MFYSYSYSQQVSSIPKDTLYVIDGIPKNVEAYKRIEPDSIVSINILKNADTLALLNCRTPNRIIIVVKTLKALTKRERRKLRQKKRLQSKVYKTDD
ncbi:hypothetical protein GCM10007424_14190 [Flavobacterium suaedae]|uniref:Uncharacterized protein n=2 Tax=Flavobacterium suaedae TaxID=1767027 RepID=A0ABQ1JVT9_9FLAO|nr:hypothetical protein GCM10007424_14190 [Flavobacterium suaedae]